MSLAERTKILSFSQANYKWARLYHSKTSLGFCQEYSICTEVSLQFFPPLHQTILLIIIFPLGMSLLVRPIFSYYNGYTGKGETETKEEKEPEAKELLEPKIVGTHTHIP